MCSDITPPLSSLTLYGGISPPFWNTMEKGVDFHPGDDVHPLCLYGLGQPVVNNGMFLDTGVLSSRGPSDLTLFSQGLMWITSLQGQAVHEVNFHLIWMPWRGEREKNSKPSREFKTQNSCPRILNSISSSRVKKYHL